jgi:hypothetical protein
MCFTRMRGFGRDTCTNLCTISIFLQSALFVWFAVLEGLIFAVLLYPNSFVSIFGLQNKRTVSLFFKRNDTRSTSNPDFIAFGVLCGIAGTRKLEGLPLHRHGATRTVTGRRGIIMI